MLISLGCISSKTHNLQPVFLRIYDTKQTKGRSLCQTFLVETGNENRCVTKATHVLQRKLRKIKFRAFPKRVGPRILSLESIDYFGTSQHH